MNHNVILIGIAGGSGSGKTSIAREIRKEFSRGEVAVIQLDSYYINLAHLDFKERQKQNFDHPDAMDFDLLHFHLSKLTLLGNCSHPSL